jgi:putative toxin-antitoxin system antitoxin component (TIGR02293 family)
VPIEIESGTLNWIDEEKGYGCIRLENGRDIHVPISAIHASDFKDLKNGEPVQFDPSFVETYIAPSTPIEKKLVAIWAQILGTPTIGINDNFFWIGGDSLSAVRATARMHEAFKINIPLRALFSAPRIAEMAKVIEHLVKSRKEQPDSVHSATVLKSVTLYEILRNIRIKLGTNIPLKSENDLVTLVEKRLPVTTISALIKHGILEQEIYSVIIPRRTLQHRRTRKEKLSREESDRAVRLARLAALTEKVFGDLKTGMHWLRAPKKRFRGSTPMAMMETEVGSRLVEEALYQIDEGMAA